MGEQRDLLTDHIKKKGGRITPSRLVILEEIYRRHDHFDAEDLFLELERNGMGISRASVYRTMPILLEAGLIRELKTEGTRKRYEHVLGHSHHEHIICAECGRIIEYEDADLEERIRKVCESKNVELVSHQVLIVGICQDCKKKTVKD